MFVSLAQVCIVYVYGRLRHSGGRGHSLGFMVLLSTDKRTMNPSNAFIIIPTIEKDDTALTLTSSVPRFHIHRKVETLAFGNN